MGFSAYTNFSRAEWARLRAATPLTLDEADLAELQGLNEQLSLDEVVEVYLPLSRLLNLHVAASRELERVTDRFLGKSMAASPYLLAVAGSVAVGKSTTARVLQALLARWPDHPRVDLVTTDGFLYPNSVLEERGLLARKGFPESYDLRRLVRFVAELKAGVPEVSAPVYSHLHYDIVPDELQVIQQPDILILEGLNVLEGGDRRSGDGGPFVSDYFNFSLYVDAEERFIKEWFVRRLQRLCETAFRDPQSYFRKYANLSEAEASAFATRVWEEINGINLRENILPTRERAHLILEKAADHRVERVRLRRL
ncbi:MAG TPA: type I pantothenate kinase [Gemmatimonadales bacterium]|jgi:type I pantothenate kinase|nr:type I pantothenate kinase [Gemmatimonadales bacterium]